MKRVMISVVFGMVISGIYAQCPDSTVFSGTATFFNSNGTGYCGMPIKTDSMYIVALNTEMYNASKACGSCMEVTGNKGSVVVMVEDVCPDCPPGQLDLSRVAFSEIAGIDAGIADVTWRNVPCPVSGGIRYFFSNGSNPYYIDLQIRNTRYAVASVEMKNNGGNFTVMQRQNYNSFTLTPAITPAESPFGIRVTDIAGNVITETIPFIAGSEIQGASQFPLCQTTGVNITQLSDNHLLIYPNPADNSVFVEMNYSLDDKAISLQLFDVNNKLIRKLPFEGNKMELDISGLSRGVYFVQVTGTRFQQTGRIIKE